MRGFLQLRVADCALRIFFKNCVLRIASCGFLRFYAIFTQFFEISLTINEENLASCPSKFSKFLPAALKKEEICLLGLPKFSKISPAALKMEVFGLRIFQNFQNFCLRRCKRKRIFDHDDWISWDLEFFWINVDLESILLSNS